MKQKVTALEEALYKNSSQELKTGSATIGSDNRRIENERRLEQLEQLGAALAVMTKDYEYEKEERSASEAAAREVEVRGSMAMFARWGVERRECHQLASAPVPPAC
jgi:uncharacterized protein (DUF1800 family)